MKKIKLRPSALQKKAKKGFRGYPAATIALYGPTDKLATKIAVAIFSGPDREADILERWFSRTGDVDIRRDKEIERQIANFVRSHHVQSVVLTDGHRKTASINLGKSFGTTVKHLNINSLA
jgi:hypothetical protein